MSLTSASQHSIIFLHLIKEIPRRAVVGGGEGEGARVCINLNQLLIGCRLMRGCFQMSFLVPYKPPFFPHSINSHSLTASWGLLSVWTWAVPGWNLGLTHCCNHCCLCVLKSLSRVQLLVTLQTVTCQASLSIEFSRQEYWSGLPFPTPRNLSNAGIEPMSPASPALAGRFFTTEPPGALSTTVRSPASQRQISYS